MSFDPDHTVEGKKQKEAELIWEKLKYTEPRVRKYSKADVKKVMKKMNIRLDKVNKSFDKMGTSLDDMSKFLKKLNNLYEKK